MKYSYFLTGIVLSLLLPFQTCTKNKKQKSHNMLTKDQLSNLYEGVNGFSIASGESEVFKQHESASTYGEITYEAMQTLIEKLHLTKKDVFYDLGSGKGQFPIQVYCNSKAHKCVGVELSTTRHNHAVAALTKIKRNNLLNSKKQLQFTEGDITDPAFDLSDATVIWMNSTCYPSNVMEKMAEKLSHLNKGVRVVTLKQLPLYEKYNFELIDQLKLPMTWSESVTTHIYKHV